MFRLRNSLLFSLVCFALISHHWGVFETRAGASEPASPRCTHPWGRFPLGAWKQVRVVTDVLSAEKIILKSTVTETTTTLVEATDHDYTLRVDTVVEVAGKRFVSRPQFARRGYHGEQDGQHVVIESLGENTVTVNGRQIPSQVSRIVVDGGAMRMVSTEHRIDESPFVLLRETTATDRSGRRQPFRTLVKALMVKQPYQVLGEMRQTTHLQITQEGPSGTTSTLEIHDPQTPGGVVAHFSKNYVDGKVTRRSRLSLLDYGISQAEQPRRLGLFRWRWPRLRLFRRN